MEKFTPIDQNSHVREEEVQWARILEQGNAKKGIIIVYNQKLCAIGHEISASIEASIATEKTVEFHAARLVFRIQKLRSFLEKGTGHTVMTKLLQHAMKLKNTVSDFEALKLMPELIHQASHVVSDELERMD